MSVRILTLRATRTRRLSDSHIAIAEIEAPPVRTMADAANGPTIGVNAMTSPKTAPIREQKATHAAAGITIIASRERSQNGFSRMVTSLDSAVATANASAANRVARHLRSLNSGDVMGKSGPWAMRL
jgi:hypothetical protein